MWPGFGENSRVLAWIFQRLTGEAKAEETAIGLVPPNGEGGIDTEGLDVSPETMAKLLEVETDGWLAQLPQMKRAPGDVRRQAAGRAQRAAGRRWSSG